MGWQVISPTLVSPASLGILFLLPCCATDGVTALNHAQVGRAYPVCTVSAYHRVSVQIAQVPKLRALLQYKQPLSLVAAALLILPDAQKLNTIIVFVLGIHTSLCLFAGTNHAPVYGYGQECMGERVQGWGGGGGVGVGGVGG